MKKVTFPNMTIEMSQQEFQLSTEFDERVFEQVASLWEAAGLAGAARGDTFEAVARTLRCGGRLLTIREGQQVVGTCWITVDGRRACLHHMAVRKDHEGRGVGSALMVSALAFASGQELQVKLEVARDNARARSLYERFNFSEIGDYVLLLNRSPGSQSVDASGKKEPRARG